MKKTVFTWEAGFSCLTLLLTCSALRAEDPKANDAPYRAIGEIQREEARLSDLLPEDAKIEVIAEGFEWAEGPVWVPEGEYVLFSDVIRNTIFKWKEGQPLDVYLKPSGYSGEEPYDGPEPGSNGLILDQNGRLIICQHGDRRVVRQESNGELNPIADDYQGQRFNSPNDIVMKRMDPSDRALYFTDPPYGLAGKNDDPKKEIKFNGVYRRATNGRISLLTDQITYPNGIGFSPDESKLYVACSDPDKAVWYEFNVQDDGKLDEGKIFFDATDIVKAGKKGLPDGMAIDSKGNLWATGPGGVLIFTPDGTHLGTLHTGEATANCTFGGSDGSTLFITADMYLCRVKTKTKGIGY